MNPFQQLVALALLVVGAAFLLWIAPREGTIDITSLLGLGLAARTIVLRWRARRHRLEQEFLARQLRNAEQLTLG